ncbi:hypothetical protein LOD99_11644 [Oopsacas minuta]|uniref:Uncharacterized protein n=1 Tax=Oopsacas minuta TaxID=111878 RepID=A0AAV7JK08_9METZ|nr:hypothetical protein LOD99_11644 [Oopsacas minuta]
MSIRFKVVTTCGQIQEESNVKESSMEMSSEQIVESKGKDQIVTSHLTLKEDKQLTQKTDLMPKNKAGNDGGGKRRMSVAIITPNELKGDPDEVYGLTRNQVEAFREVFTLFDI